MEIRRPKIQNLNSLASAVFTDEFTASDFVAQDRIRAATRQLDHAVEDLLVETIGTTAAQILAMPPDDRARFDARWRLEWQCQAGHGSEVRVYDHGRCVGGLRFSPPDEPEPSSGMVSVGWKIDRLRQVNAG